MPTGTWTGIKWSAIPAGYTPAVVPSGDQGSNASIEGWSKGFIDFIWSPHKRTLTPWISADGLTWREGSNVDISGLATYLKDADSSVASGDSFYDDCGFVVDNFQEGPATLLLTGHLICGDSAGCGSDGSSDRLTWTSSDGSSWRPEAAMPDPDATVSGGSSGFVVLKNGALWTSQDGQKWVQQALPPAARSAGSSINDPVSFSGGFVLPEVVRVKPGHVTTGSGGCGGDGGADLSMYRAALWWSPDGITWTRATLSGSISSYSGVWMSVARVDDHTVVAQATVGTTQVDWASTDGQTWTRLKGNPLDLSTTCIVAGRNRGLVAVGSSDPNQYVPDFSNFDDTLGLVSIKQTGDLPWDGGQVVLGPTGLLVTDDGTAFWIGVPTVG